MVSWWDLCGKKSSTQASNYKFKNTQIRTLANKSLQLVTSINHTWLEFNSLFSNSAASFATSANSMCGSLFIHQNFSLTFRQRLIFLALYFFTLISFFISQNFDSDFFFFRRQINKFHSWNVHWLRNYRTTIDDWLETYFTLKAVMAITNETSDEEKRIEAVKKI